MKTCFFLEEALFIHRSFCFFHRSNFPDFLLLKTLTIRAEDIFQNINQLVHILVQNCHFHNICMKFNLFSEKRTRFSNTTQLSNVSRNLIFSTSAILATSVFLEFCQSLQLWQSRESQQSWQSQQSRLT